MFGVNTVVVPLSGHKCFIVDPAACSLSFDQNKVTDYLSTKKMECIGIVLTHSHFDHITGIRSVKNCFPKCKIAVHELEFAEMQNPPGPMNDSVIRFFGALDLLNEVGKQPSADTVLHDGNTLDILLNDCTDTELQKSLSNWKVIHTPGHTPGSICLYNETDRILISGDTLFDYGGYGRTDMYGGDEALIRKSLNLIREKCVPGTLVYPGHDSFGFSL